MLGDHTVDAMTHISDVVLVPERACSRLSRVVASELHRADNENANEYWGSGQIERGIIFLYGFIYNGSSDVHRPEDTASAGEWNGRCRATTSIGKKVNGERTETRLGYVGGGQLKIRPTVAIERRCQLVASRSPWR